MGLANLPSVGVEFRSSEVALEEVNVDPAVVAVAAAMAFCVSFTVTFFVTRWVNRR